MLHKMRKAIVYCMIILVASHLIGCNNNEEGIEASELLLESMGALENLDAVSYKAETTIQRSDNTFSEDVSEIKIIYDPYTMFTESETGVEKDSKFIAQAFQRENPDGSMDLFLRNTENDERLGEWNVNHMPPEIAAIVLPQAKDNMKQSIELLRANKALFSVVGIEQMEDRNTIVLKGAITPDSAAQIYNEYLRDYYRETGMVEDIDLTVRAAKEEILSSEIAELKTGISALVFSPNDIPVTIWIDEETHTPVKLELDKTEVMQALLHNDEVEKAVTTFTLLESGSLVSISVPEGII